MDKVDIFPCRFYVNFVPWSLWSNVKPFTTSSFVTTKNLWWSGKQIMPFARHKIHLSTSNISDLQLTTTMNSSLYNKHRKVSSPYNHLVSCQPLPASPYHPSGLPHNLMSLFSFGHSPSILWTPPTQAQQFSVNVYSLGSSIAGTPLSTHCQVIHSNNHNIFSQFSGANEETIKFFNGLPLMNIHDVNYESDILTRSNNHLVSLIIWNFTSIKNNHI